MTSALQFLESLPDFAPGSVWLVGAGPGDPGLISALGLKALAEADFVLHDALVDGALLALARGERIYAGKRAGVRSCKQNDITETLIRLARAGHKVLRLKGGDPFTFGRGGEEAQALAAAGIGFRIVPGITAGIGGLAYAGIPVTHRDTNHAVTFVTGHGSDGKLPKLDWNALGKGSQTLVFYMARPFAGEIAAKLLASGRSETEPAAIVSDAARAGQQTILTTLKDLPEAAAKSPALSLLVVGANVALAKTLRWWK